MIDGNDLPLVKANSDAGPTLIQDTKAVFHADHHNLASPGAVPSITTIACQ